MGVGVSDINWEDAEEKGTIYAMFCNSDIALTVAM